VFTLRCQNISITWIGTAAKPANTTVHFLYEWSSEQEFSALCVSRRLPTAAVFGTTLVHMEFVLGKMSLGQIFCTTTSVFLASSHSTKSSTLICHLSTAAGVIEPLWPVYQEDSVSAHPTNGEKKYARFFKCTRPFQDIAWPRGQQVAEHCAGRWRVK
jgi:hypothetical protein